MNLPVNADPSTSGNIDSGNIVQRLKIRIKEAQKLGFRVRFELLDDEQPSWCVLGKTKVLFLDLAQSANEQLRSLNEVLDSFLAAESGQPKPQSPAEPTQRSAA